MRETSGVTWAQPHTVTFLLSITSSQGPHLSDEVGGLRGSGLFKSEILGLLFLEPEAPAQMIAEVCSGSLSTIELNAKFLERKVVPP